MNLGMDVPGTPGLTGVTSHSIAELEPTELTEPKINTEQTAKLPKQDKLDNETWLILFERAARINGWDDVSMIYQVPFYMTKDSARWATLHTFTSWNDFSIRFKQKYLPLTNDTHTLAALLNFKQQTGEALSDYMTRWDGTKLLLKNQDILPDTVLINAFTNGLQDQALKDQLTIRIMDNTLDAEKLVAYLYSYQQHHQLSQPHGLLTDSPSSDLKTLRTELSDMKLTMQTYFTNVTAKQHNSSNNTAQAPIQTNKNAKCYNCKQNGHYSADCPLPCKFCQSQEHRHYQCQDSKAIEARSQYASKQQTQQTTNSSAPATTNQTQQAAMLITAKPIDAFAMDTNMEPIVNKDTSQNPPPPIDMNKLEPSTKRMDQDMENQTPLHESSTKKIKVHDVIRRTAIVDEPLKLMDILNEPVYTLSLSQICSLNSQLRSKVKNALTKPYQNKPQQQSAKLVKPLPPGTSAPWIVCRLNKKTVSVILDGGCVPNLISLKILASIGISEFDTTNIELHTADGNTTRPLGEVKGLNLEINGDLFKINAIVMEHSDFDLLLGRHTLHQCSIKTDWTTHEWTLNNKPLSVAYESYPADDSDDSSMDGYYVNFLDYQPTTASAEIKELGSERFTDKLGNLLEKVKKNELLSTEQRAQLVKMVETYADVFGTSFSHVKQTNLVDFEVKTGDAAPIYRRPYAGLSWQEKKTLEQELQKMLSDGIIIPAKYGAGSGWSFPVRLISKKDGGKRLITDFRLLNKVTVRDTYPLPNIQDLLDSLAGSSCYSTLDLLKGFHQIAVHSNSIDKLTITTHMGNFSYTVMPFGVVNGPSTFSRLINMVIAPLQHSTIAYIDDLTIHSESIKQHLVDIESLLIRLRSCNLVLNSTKCELITDTIDFLGFQIKAKSGVSPLPSKIEMIVAFPKPTDATAVRAFLGLMGFFRRHVLLFAELGAPLTTLLKKNQPYEWTDQCENSFRNMKNALINAPSLLLPLPGITFELFTDASDIAIGGTLVQQTKPIGFVSRKLLDVETRYTVMERELLALVYCLAKFRRYLVDAHFRVYTDNKAVKFLVNKETMNARMARWVLLIQEFDFDIHHISGKHNVVADVMSRYPPDGIQASKLSSDVSEPILCHGLLVTEGLYETELQQVYSYLLEPSGSVDHRTKIKSRGFIVKDGVLLKRIGSRTLKVPSLKDRQGILVSYHDGHGHFGFLSTWIRLYSHYWWPKIYDDCKSYLTSCHNCQLFDAPPRPLPYRSVYVGNIFERFCMDYIGPFPETQAKNRYILLVVECFTRYPLAIACQRDDAITAASFLYSQVFCHYGPPIEILSDNGTHFVNKIVDNFLDIIKTRHVLTLPYRPNVNGMAEKINGVLVKSLKRTIHNITGNWDDYLNSILFAYRTKTHSALRLSPFELMYGTSANPMDNDIIDKIGTAYGFERLMKIIDLREDTYFSSIEGPAANPDNHYNVGDKVLKIKLPNHHRRKLDPVYEDQVYTIIASFENDVYQLFGLDGHLPKRRTHGSQLRLYSTAR
jgi:transposase InsO family protein